jgi:hypothetical protein
VWANVRVGRTHAVWEVGARRVIWESRARTIREGRACTTEEGGAACAVDEGSAAVGHRGIACAVEEGAVAVGCRGKSRDDAQCGSAHAHDPRNARREQRHRRKRGWRMGHVDLWMGSGAVVGGRVVFGNDIAIVP